MSARLLFDFVGCCLEKAGFRCHSTYVLYDMTLLSITTMSKDEEVIWHRSRRA